MAAYYSIFAWKSPWTEESGGLQSRVAKSRTRLSNFTFSFKVLNIGDWPINRCEAPWNITKAHKVCLKVSFVPKTIRILKVRWNAKGPIANWAWKVRDPCRYQRHILPVQRLHFQSHIQPKCGSWPSYSQKSMNQNDMQRFWNLPLMEWVSSQVKAEVE